MTDTQIVDLLSDEELIEGFACLSDNIHDYAWRYLGDDNDKEETKEAYRSGFRDMIHDYKKWMDEHE